MVIRGRARTCSNYILYIQTHTHHTYVEGFQRALLPLGPHGAILRDQVQPPGGVYVHELRVLLDQGGCALVLALFLCACGFCLVCSWVVWLERPGGLVGVAVGRLDGCTRSVSAAYQMQAVGCTGEIRQRGVPWGRCKGGEQSVLVVLVVREG